MMIGVVAVSFGSPPRVRSRRDGCARSLGPFGITSACAEQTGFVANRWYRQQDHLRVCGADADPGRLLQRRHGSPPRVRSRHRAQRRHRHHHGITSACAEQTDAGTCGRRAKRDHLRVCGADVDVHEPKRPTSGSPPRVRSRHGDAPAYRLGAGITSACAEQTWPKLASIGSQGGSPPRVRSRPRPPDPPTAIARITSACAEQTQGGTDISCYITDHLRVCGAD